MIMKNKFLTMIALILFAGIITAGSASASKEVSTASVQMSSGDVTLANCHSFYRNVLNNDTGAYELQAFTECDMICWGSGIPQYCGQAVMPGWQVPQP